MALDKWNFLAQAQIKIKLLLWGLRKFGPKIGGKQGELAKTCTCLKCIPKGWLVVWPTREVMTPFAYFNCVAWDLGFSQNLNVASRTLISIPLIKV
jgi:hypothetical protein